MSMQFTKTGKLMKHLKKPRALKVTKAIQPVLVVNPTRKGAYSKKIKHPFPRSRVVDLVYNYTQNITTGTAMRVFGTEHAFNLTKITVPRVGQAAGDLLPQGISSFIGIYQKYKVLSNKVKITFTETPAQSNTAVGVFATSSADQETITGKTFALLAMKKNSWEKALGTDGKSVIYTKTFYPWVLDGITKQAYMNDFYEYEGNMTLAIGAAVAPFRFPRLHLAVVNLNDVSNNTVIYDVEMIYKTKLYMNNVLPVSQSTA